MIHDHRCLFEVPCHAHWGGHRDKPSVETTGLGREWGCALIACPKRRARVTTLIAKVFSRIPATWGEWNSAIPSPALFNLSRCGRHEEAFNRPRSRLGAC
jgi:hypothetical protein